MTKKAAKTGPGAMVLVAIEQGFPEAERIITDELACPILPISSRIWVRLSLLTASVLRRGLDLLGIETPTRM